MEGTTNKVDASDTTTDCANENQDLLTKAIGVLKSETFTSRTILSFDRRPAIKLANSVGGPRMKLIHSNVIASLGRIPRSSEGHARDAMELLDYGQYPSTEVFFFSHRWLRPNMDRSKGYPDTQNNVKAKALIEFVEWRQNWVSHNHGFVPTILFWIDYSCFDQDNLGPGIALLPLWTACCERFLRFETPSYHERAWCRLEPLLSAKFSFADHHTVIREGYTNSWPDTGQPSTSLLLDPTKGQLSDPTDLERIQPLIDLALDPDVGHQAIVPSKTSIKTFEL